MPRIEEIALVNINIRIWKYLAILYPSGDNNWRKYAFVLPVCLMNVLQFIYLQRMWGDPPAFILNAFFFSAIFNALMRTLLVIAKRVQFEEFLGELQRLYEVIWATEDDICCGILQKAEREARDIAIFNLCASFFDITGAVVFSLFSKDRVHPFGIALPQVDMTRSPVYEIFCILEIPTPVVLSIMYMPFVSLFAAFALFGRAMLQILSNKLSRIKDLRTSEERHQMLIHCIEFHSNIVRYVKMFNELVSFIVGAEAIIFGSIICSLLFCLNLINSSTQMISVIMYIFTMLYVLFTYYNRAQDLVMESHHVSEAVYDVPWYECDIRFRKTLLFFLMQTQRTLVILILVFWLYVYAPFHFISRQIKVGNVYPMTLAMFQSLLNASYSYFTMLRGVTNK